MWPPPSSGSRLLFNLENTVTATSVPRSTRFYFNILSFIPAVRIRVPSILAGLRALESNNFVSRETALLVIWQRLGVIFTTLVQKNGLLIARSSTRSIFCATNASGLNNNARSFQTDEVTWNYLSNHCPLLSLSRIFSRKRFRRQVFDIALAAQTMLVIVIFYFTRGEILQRGNSSSREHWVGRKYDDAT